MWTLLFVIPGIVKYYSYAMAPYIMIENPDMSASDVISESRRLMDGHKWELFVLDLSFIGWEFLTAITFGLVGIYLIPYYNETYAAYYRYVKSCKGESSPVPDFNIDAI